MHKVNLDVEYSKKSIEEVIQHKSLFGFPEHLSDLSPEQYRKLVNKDAFFFVDDHNCLRHQFSGEIMATDKQQVDILIEQLQALKETINDVPQRNVMKTYIGKHWVDDDTGSYMFNKALVSNDAISFDFKYSEELNYTVSLKQFLSKENVYIGTAIENSEREVIALELVAKKDEDEIILSGKWREKNETYDTEIIIDISG